MEMQQWLWLVAAFVAGAAAAWGGALWWFGRKLRDAAGSRERVDKARQFAAQQAAQARKQIESLQQEMAALRLASKKRGVVMPPPMSPLQPPMDTGLLFGNDDDVRDSAADGFADTQVMAPGKRGAA